MRAACAILVNGVLEPQPAVVIDEVLTTRASEGGLLALALDAQFDRTHFVYAAYTVAGPQGTRRFRVVRYREVEGRLGERVVLLDAIPAAARPAASLGDRPGRPALCRVRRRRGSGRRTPPLASYSGKVLRLNTDGTTPQDQPAGLRCSQPTFSRPAGSTGIPETGALWIADAKRRDVEELRIVPPAARRATSAAAGSEPARRDRCGSDCLLSRDAPARRCRAICSSPPEERASSAAIAFRQTRPDARRLERAAAAGAAAPSERLPSPTAIYVATDRAVLRLGRSCGAQLQLRAFERR